MSIIIPAWHWGDDSIVEAQGKTRENTRNKPV